MQAPSPVPRKAADSTTGSRQNVKKNPNAQQRPSDLPAPVVNSIAAKPNEDGSRTPSDTNAKETIIIREPAPMAGGDGWNHVYVVFTGMLVGVGALGIWLARRTLKAIERQTTHLRRSVVFARRSANATRKSVEALINAERPWVVPKIRKAVRTFKPTKIEGIDDDMPDVKRVPYFAFIITNLGRTPAEIMAIKGQPEFTDEGMHGGLKDPPDYGRETILRRVRMLAPRERWEYDGADLTTTFPDQQIMEQIHRTMTKHVIFKGQILYRDTFRPEVIHETRFCYTYLHPLDEWVSSGPPDHTKYT
jgi:hypothetical protein